LYNYLVGVQKLKGKKNGGGGKDVKKKGQVCGSGKLSTPVLGEENRVGETKGEVLGHHAIKFYGDRCRY